MAIATQQSWRLLQVFSTYRLLVLAILIMIYALNLSGNSLGAASPRQFEITIFLYTILALCFCGLALARLSSITVQTIFQISCDLILLQILMRSCGGLDSGIGFLILITLAAASVLLPGRLPLFFAAMITLSLFIEASFFPLAQQPIEYALFQLGILGASFFLTCIITQSLAKKLQQTEKIIAKNEQRLTQLSGLNDVILQQLHSGVIAVDNDGKIQLMNEQAKKMFAFEGKAKDILLQAVVPALAELCSDLLAQKANNITACSRQLSNDYMCELIYLSDLADGMTLIFIEDNRELAQQAQQMKLASLGRFTASIAHELRNPLGAISHATQLLAESEQANVENKRLLEIINNHIERLNITIKNILQLSRREKTEVTAINVTQWLNEFVADFKSIQNENINFTIDTKCSELMINVDPSQLYQVLTNLCENAQKYGSNNDGQVNIRLHAYRHQDNYAVLEIIDSGNGVSSEMQQYLFEPFHTSDRNGTGLGLFIARELCEANQTRLSYVAEHKTGACFRLSFH